MLKRVYRLNGVRMPQENAIKLASQTGGIVTITWEWSGWFQEPDVPSIGADSLMELGMESIDEAGQPWTHK